MSLRDILVSCALEAGFPVAGTVDIERARLDPHVHTYDEWLARGYSGAMTYLVRGRDRRADPCLVFPEAKSVLTVLAPYDARPAGQMESRDGVRYARYIRSNDYHLEMAKRLEAAMRSASTHHPELKWKVCVDTSAVLERTWAVLSGLGWIGKNGLLIHPQLGSYLFIGVVLLNQSMECEPTVLPNFCGNCTRCTSSCPTRAIIEPAIVDSRKCISYLTLEKRGSMEIDEETKRSMGCWVAGCDICQEVCPFNTKASKKPLEQPNGATSVSDWRSLLQETEAQYLQRIDNSSLDRIKPKQFSRNLAVALANALIAHPELTEDLRAEITRRREKETDPDARSEWERCEALALR